MNFRPLHNRVAVKRVAEGESSKQGGIIPDISKGRSEAAKEADVIISKATFDNANSAASSFLRKEIQKIFNAE